MLRATGAVCLLMLFSSSAVMAQTQWYRGNTHVHTINSDGDSAPDVVVRWYREHRYHFVVLTDHDYLTPVDGLNAVFGAPGKFIVIPGVEVTDRFNRQPVHTNGLNVERVVLPQGGTGVADILNRDARAIREAGGVAQINHPNGAATLGARALAEATEAKLFEVCCADERGGGDAPSTEEMWDQVLSSGRRLYAVAGDDAHSFRAGSTEPGAAWIMVRARTLTAASLLAAIEAGDFYATTGVEFKDYQASGQEIRIALDDRQGARYRTYFIGRDGELLKRDDTPTPTYRFTGREQYVRARVERADGKTAWTQPVFLR
ncbi:MAG TPA: CehA/McbA family metallohydrolase [Pyrinomonadaceae bacterium]|jgi:hypothetical protein